MGFFMRVLPIFCLLLPGGASAAQIDCTTLRLDVNGCLAYQEVEVFPNPAKQTAVKLDQQTKPFQISLCGVTITADRGQYSFKTKDIKTLATVLGTGLSWRYVIYGEHQAAGRTTYPEAATVTIALPDSFHNQVRITGYFSGRYLPADALMAVRIDGGKLLPLLFNGTFRDVEIGPKMSKMEFFLKSGKPLHWEKMVLDVANSQMTFVKRAPFPVVR